MTFYFCLIGKLMKSAPKERLLQLWVACSLGMLREVYSNNAMLLRRNVWDNELLSDKLKNYTSKSSFRVKEWDVGKLVLFISDFVFSLIFIFTPYAIGTLCWIPLLMVLQSSRHPHQAAECTKTWQTQMGRLSGENRRVLYCQPHQDWRLVWWYAALHLWKIQSRQEILCPAIHFRP